MHSFHFKIKMRFYLVIFIIFGEVKLGRSFNRPPKITVQSNVTEIYIRIGEPEKIPCVAEGFPKPTYRWERNGKDFAIGGAGDRVSHISGTGTIFFNQVNGNDNGIYQCFAENQFGVAVSEKFNLIEAKLENFEQSVRMVYHILDGDSLTLHCTPPLSYPLAFIYWVLKSPDGKVEPIIFNKRISMDLEGRLHFSNVEKYDERDGKTYACMVANYFLRRNTMGPEHMVHVYGNRKQRPTEIQWTSPRDQIVLKDETLRIQCIFAGNPAPDINWEKVDGYITDRVEFKDFGHELRINNVEESDAGRYKCSGTNPIMSGVVSKIFDVRIESAPHWTEEPQDVEKSTNDTATFICRAAGIPPPTYAWYINGNPLQNNHLENIEKDQTILDDSRFSILDENTVMLRNVTVGDQMNIQCNASNKHGYVFADVYLNILDDDQDKPTIEGNDGGSVPVDEEKKTPEQKEDLMDYQMAYYKGMVERQDLEREMLEVKVRVLKAVENKLNDLNVKKLLDSLSED